MLAGAGYQLGARNTRDAGPAAGPSGLFPRRVFQCPLDQTPNGLGSDWLVYLLLAPMVDQLDPLCREYDPNLNAICRRPAAPLRFRHLSSFTLAAEAFPSRPVSRS